MDPQHIRYFLAVFDHGSINAASDAVSVAQPTISQAIRSLERDLRTALFYRMGRGMVPTSAGYVLVGPARRILRDLATAAGSAPGADGQLRGRVDLRAHPGVIGGILPRLVAEYHRRHPHVQVTVSAMYDDTDGVGLLNDALCELVVTYLPLPAENAIRVDRAAGGLATLELGTQIYDLALPPDRDAPRTGELSWDELDEAMVVAPRGAMHIQRMFEAMSPRQQERRPAVVLQNREARLAFTLAGVAPTWIERSMRQWALERGAGLRTMEPELYTAFGLVYQDETLSPGARAFVDLAHETTGWADQPAGANVDRNAAEAGVS